LIAIHDDD